MLEFSGKIEVWVRSAARKYYVKKTEPTGAGSRLFAHVVVGWAAGVTAPAARPFGRGADQAKNGATRKNGGDSVIGGGKRNWRE